MKSPASEDWQKLLNDIRKEYKYTCGYTGRPLPDPRVMKAMAKVPRHEFVPPALRGQAYYNSPLPIGMSQTISQPYIVALMTDLLDLREDSTVLEVGTGSGYQAAVLAQIAAKVYSTEIIEDLAVEAGNRLKRLGYDNIVTGVRDGYNGWPEFAPFDGIIVTAAAAEIPPPLVEQLAPGANLVIPVGNRSYSQQLLVVGKKEDSSIRVSNVLDVVFVPLTGPLGR